MAIQTVADLVTRASTSPTITSNQYRQERENVAASIGLEKTKAPVSAVSDNPPKMYFGQAGTSVPEVKPQGQGQSPFSGSNIAPPRTDYATGISSAERSRTGMGAQVTAESRTNDVLGLVRQGLSNPQELQRYLNVNQAGGVASGYTEAEIARIIQENQKAVQEGQQYRQQAIAGGATPQTLEQQALQAVKAAEDERKMSFNRQQEYLNRQFQSAYNTRELAQKSEAGQSNLRLARMGAFEAKSGESYEASLNTRHKSELFDIETKRMAALNAAQNAYDKDSLEIAYKKLEEVRALGDQMIKKDAENRAKEKEAREIQKYEKEDLAATFEGMIEDGVDVDSIPEGYIEQQYPNLTRMDAITLFNTVKRDRDAKTKKTAQEQKKADTENARDIQNILQKVPLGQQITIGGVEYTGLERGDIKTGTETAPDGSVTFWSYDESTGETKTTSLGTIGQKKDGWDLKFDADGNPWKFNGQTGQLLPSYPSITQTAVQQVIPDGSISPFKDENGNPRVQCGEFVNDMTGIGVGDTFESKMAKMNLWKKGDNIQSIVSQLKPGDVFTQKLGTWTGHVGTILGVETAPNGQIQIRALESNYPQAGKVTSTRLIPIEKIDGFGRGTKVSPVLKTGPDSATFATKKDKETDKDLSVAEAKSLGVPFGTTVEDAKKLKKVPTDKAVDDKPLSGEASKLKSITESIQPEIDQLIAAFEKDYRGALVGITTGKDRALSRLLDQVADKVGRLRSGGGINKDEEARFKRQVASFMDIPFGKSEDAIKSLRSLKDEAKIVRDSVAKPSPEAATVAPAERIRVKLKSSNKTGTIDASEFDANLYERL